MSGNTLGTLFTVTSFGESHGPALGCVVDGCPQLALNEADIQHDLDRRKPGTSRHVTQRRESDTVEILSGVFEGRTTGTPIALLIANDRCALEGLRRRPRTIPPRPRRLHLFARIRRTRPSRCRSEQSARETAVRVAAGAIAKKWLNERYGVIVRGCLTQIGEIEIQFKSWDGVSHNPFFSPDPGVVQPLEDYMDGLRKSGDSIGAKLMVVAENVPVGWGEPVLDRLDAEIAYALMSINAVKGVEIGAGFASVTQHGSQHGETR